MIGTSKFLPCKGRGTSRRLVEGRRASGGPLPARTALPSTTLLAVPLPVPGRNCATYNSPLIVTLRGSRSTNKFLPSMGRGTSRRLVEGRRASGEPLSVRGRNGL